MRRPSRQGFLCLCIPLSALVACSSDDGVAQTTGGTGGASFAYPGTGGFSAGGAPSAGTSNGGGVSSGGAATGGVSSGGAATGGAATGGIGGGAGGTGGSSGSSGDADASADAGDASTDAPDAPDASVPAKDGGGPSDGGLDVNAWTGGPVPPATPVGCVTDVTTEAQPGLACNGLTYDLSIPPRCLTTQCGLIFDVHGGTMSGAMEDKNTNLAALGKTYGYVVVHPTAAFAGLWNYATDDPKVFAFMQDMQSAFHTDPKRLHITGLSQGGYMSWRFLCQHTDVIASAAPAAAAGAANISTEVGCTFTGTDVPSGEIDILYMHGTQDALVNFPNAITLRDAVISFYKMGAGKVVAGDSTYQRTRYAAPGGHVFEFVQHDYTSPSAIATVAIKGHCFPGSADQTVTLPGQLMSFGCTPPNSFTWGEEVMKFFIAHPKH